MKQLKSCVWVGPSKTLIGQPIKSIQIKSLVPEGKNAEFHSEGHGMWAFFSSVSDAIAFAYAVIESKESMQLSVLITVGELLFDDGRWSGWTLDKHRRLTQSLEPNRFGLQKHCFI